LGKLAKRKKQRARSAVGCRINGRFDRFWPRVAYRFCAVRDARLDAAALANQSIDGRSACPAGPGGAFTNGDQRCRPHPARCGAHRCVKIRAWEQPPREKETISRPVRPASAPDRGQE
jgi:hypothetical protein